MKCDFCENKANNFLSMIVDGKMTQVNMCDQCSKNGGLTDTKDFQKVASLLLDTVAQKRKGGRTREG